MCVCEWGGVHLTPSLPTTHPVHDGGHWEQGHGSGGVNQSTVHYLHHHVELLRTQQHSSDLQQPPDHFRYQGMGQGPILEGLCDDWNVLASFQDLVLEQGVEAVSQRIQISLECGGV